MDFVKRLSTLEVHDSVLKSITLSFDASYISMEVDFFQEETGDYVTNHWTFLGVSEVAMTNLSVSAGDIEIFSLDIREGDKNSHRITFQFLQGPGKPSASLEIVFKEAKSTDQPNEPG